MERAVGEQAIKLVRRDLAFWKTTGNVEAIEEWRQRQMRRMYCQLGLAMQLGFAAY